MLPIKVYGDIGLTPLELFEKSHLYLERQGEGMVSHNFKAISMFLLRLKRHGLARREKEMRTFRYFITINGLERRSYYKSHKKI